MQVKVTAYGPGVQGWQGYIEPEDKSWILFVHADGTPVLSKQRDPVTGASLDLPRGMPPCVSPKA